MYDVRTEQPINIISMVCNKIEPNTDRSWQSVFINDSNETYYYMCSSLLRYIYTNVHPKTPKNVNIERNTKSIKKGHKRSKSSPPRIENTLPAIEMKTPAPVLISNKLKLQNTPRTVTKKLGFENENVNPYIGATKALWDFEKNENGIRARKKWAFRKDVVYKNNILDSFVTEISLLSPCMNSDGQSIKRLMAKNEDFQCDAKALMADLKKRIMFHTKLEWKEELDDEMDPRDPNEDGMKNEIALSIKLGTLLSNSDYSETQRLLKESAGIELQSKYMLKNRLPTIMKYELDNVVNIEFNDMHKLLDTIASNTSEKTIGQI